MTVRIGEMRHRVEVQKYTLTKEEDGGSIRTFATENTMSAKIMPLNATERDQGDQVKAVRSHRVTMRFYSPGLREDDRLKLGTRIFNIVAVIDVGERGCFTILDVKEAFQTDG